MTSAVHIVGFHGYRLVYLLFVNEWTCCVLRISKLIGCTTRSTLKASSHTETFDMIFSLSWLQCNLSSLISGLIEQCGLCVQQLKRDMDALDIWLNCREGVLHDPNLGDSIDTVEELLRKHEDFEKTVFAQEDKFNAIKRRTLVSILHTWKCFLQFKFVCFWTFLMCGHDRDTCGVRDRSIDSFLSWVLCTAVIEFVSFLAGSMIFYLRIKNLKQTN